MRGRDVGSPKSAVSKTRHDTLNPRSAAAPSHARKNAPSLTATTLATFSHKNHSAPISSAIRRKRCARAPRGSWSATMSRRHRPIVEKLGHGVPPMSMFARYRRHGTTLMSPTFSTRGYFAARKRLHTASISEKATAFHPSGATACVAASMPAQTLTYFNGSSRRLDRPSIDRAPSARPSTIRSVRARRCLSQALRGGRALRARRP